MASRLSPSAALACAASSAARLASGCLRVTPSTTFQPLLVASVFSRVRSAGVSVATAHDGCGSPVDVQNVVSTKLPPKRITPGPRVFMYCARLPADGAVPVSTFASNEKPNTSAGSEVPVGPPTESVTVAAGDRSARAAAAVDNTTAADSTAEARRRVFIGRPQGLGVT